MKKNSKTATATVKTTSNVNVKTAKKEDAVKKNKKVAAKAVKAETKVTKKAEKKAVKKAAVKKDDNLILGKFRPTSVFGKIYLALSSKQGKAIPFKAIKAVGGKEVDGIGRLHSLRYQLSKIKAAPKVEIDTEKEIARLVKKAA